MKLFLFYLLVLFCVLFAGPAVATENATQNSAGGTPPASPKTFRTFQIEQENKQPKKETLKKEEETEIFENFILKEKKKNEQIRQEILQTQEEIIRDLEEARKKFLAEIEKTLKKNEVSGNKKTKQKNKPKKKETTVSFTTKTTPEKKKTENRKPSIPDYIHIFPESKTFVPISRIDINRFVCSKGKVSGVFYSRDKGLVATKAGKNLFLRVIPDSFAFKHPFELYLVCNDKGEEYTYTMILTPEDISSRTVILQGGISQTVTKKAYTDPRMKRIINIVKQAYNENFDRSLKILRVFKKTDPAIFKLPEKIQVVRYLEVDTGDWVAELYFLSSHFPSPVRLTEEQFVSDDTIAVSVFTPTVPANGFGKVLIIREKIKSIFE